MHIQKPSLLVIASIALYAHARQLTRIDGKGHTLVNECEWWGMPQGCDKNRTVQSFAEQTVYTLEASTSTSSSFTTVTTTVSTISNTVTQSVEQPQPSQPLTSLPTTSSTSSTTVVAMTTKIRPSTSSETTTATTTGHTNKHPMPTLSPAPPTTTPTTATDTTPPPPPPPPQAPPPPPTPSPAPYDPFLIAIRTCTGPRSDNRLHCNGECDFKAYHCEDDDGCPIAYETEAECIETDGRALVEACDKSVNYFHRGEDGTCNGLNKWGDSVGVREDGTHVYNTPKTRRVKVFPNRERIWVRDWVREGR